MEGERDRGEGRKEREERMNKQYSEYESFLVLEGGRNNTRKIVAKKKENKLRKSGKERIENQENKGEKKGKERIKNKK